MSSEFVLRQGAGQKLEFAVQRNGGTTEDIEYLSTGENFRAITLLRTGKAKLVEVSEKGPEDQSLPIAPTPVEWTIDAEGNIHFTVTSNGMSPQQWVRHLKRRGFRLSDWARNVLCYATEDPTKDVTYHVVVRPGGNLAASDRVVCRIREHAKNQGWQTPHWEVACLIRDTFSDQEIQKMGLWWIVAMHEPIIDFEGNPRLLHSDRSGDGRWLDVGYGKPGDEWDAFGGFVFVVPQ